MQEKIMIVLTDFHPMRVSKEKVYETLIEKFNKVKITTFLTEFYKLVREGTINGRDAEGLYGLGVVRTRRLDDWLPVTQEPLEDEKEFGENND